MGWYADTRYEFEVLDLSALKAFIDKVFEGWNVRPDLTSMEVDAEPPPWMELLGQLIGEDNYIGVCEKASMSGQTAGKCFFDGESMWKTAGVRGTVEVIPDSDPDDRALYVISPGEVVRFDGVVTVTYPGSDEHMRKVGLAS
jgi:hypothetical protein